MNESNQSPSPKPRPGLLCEDAHSLEVRDQDGRDRLVRTDDRARTAANMSEANGPLRPTAPPQPKGQ